MSNQPDTRIDALVRRGVIAPGQHISCSPLSLVVNADGRTAHTSDGRTVTNLTEGFSPSYDDIVIDDTTTLANAMLAAEAAELAATLTPRQLRIRMHEVMGSPIGRRNWHGVIPDAPPILVHTLATISAHAWKAGDLYRLEEHHLHNLVHQSNQLGASTFRLTDDAGPWSGHGGLILPAPVDLVGDVGVIALRAITWKIVVLEHASRGAWLLEGFVDPASAPNAPFRHPGPLLLQCYEMHPLDGEVAAPTPANPTRPVAGGIDSRRVPNPLAAVIASVWQHPNWVTPTG